MNKGSGRLPKIKRCQGGQPATLGRQGVPKRGQFWFYEEIARSGRFEQIECHVGHADLPMTSDEYVRLVSTFSPFPQRSRAGQEELTALLRSTVDGLGGVLLLDLRTTMVLATPRSTCARAEALVATTG